MVHHGASEVVGAEVAHFARLGCRNVTWRLASRTLSVVTRGAARCDAVVVHHSARKVVRALVALLARLGGWNVPWRLPPCEPPIVAGRTPVADAVVVHHRARESIGALVALFARLRCRDVSWRFASGKASVVARRTSVSDALVVHCCKGESLGALVATLARLAGRDMIGLLPWRLSAVVAAGAALADASVVHLRAFERSGTLVADLARLVRGNVTGRFTGCTSAIVASGAVVRDAGMVETGRRPPQRRVTDLARLSGLDVARGLALRTAAIVALRTSCRRIAMMKDRQGRPTRSRMATPAVCRGGHVPSRLAFSLHAAVAPFAGVPQGTVIDEQHLLPGVRSMTIAASVARLDMRRGLCRSFRRVRRGAQMTVGAGRARSFEHSTGVASFAGDHFVLSAQRKSCRAVIEGFVDPLFFSGRIATKRNACGNEQIEEACDREHTQIIPGDTLSQPDEQTCLNAAASHQAAIPGCSDIVKPPLPDR